PEVIGVFQNPKAEVKFNGYPYRVQPPMPSVPMVPQYNNQCFQPGYQYPYPPNNIPVNNGFPPSYMPVNNGGLPASTYVDSRTRSVNKAREDEELRLKRQKKHNKDLESVELTQGRLVVNLGKPDEDPDVFVAQHLTHVLKPHQLGGIRFMYENVIESVQTYKETPGVGCVLAHSMGLGKTLQIIAFVDIYFRTVEAKHVLIICP
uniref:SNF2 N-terminal domain-containing protein n=1 Tax=Panagrolaimus sp. ES5 TaxID=591445 RepID=A0AC34GIH0_9BILA